MSLTISILYTGLYFVHYSEYRLFRFFVEFFDGALCSPIQLSINVDLIMYYDDKCTISFDDLCMHKRQQRSRQIPTGVLSKFSYLYKHALGRIEYASHIKTSSLSFVMHGFTCSLLVLGDSVLVLKLFSFLHFYLCCLIHYSDLQHHTKIYNKKIIAVSPVSLN